MEKLPPPPMSVYPFTGRNNFQFSVSQESVNDNELQCK